MEASFERVLVPVDFSAAARAAFALAMRIADRWGSQVICFCASGLGANDEFLNDTGVVWGKTDVLREARDHLRRFVDTVVPGSAERVRLDVVKQDDPVRAVVEASARHAATLVVLGTPARDRRRVLRTHAERTARALRCPVLMVPGEPEARVDADT